MTVFLRRAGFAVLPPLALFAIWWVASANSTSFYFPSLALILESLVEVWFGSRLLDDVLPSLARLGMGYGIALALAVTLGVLIGTYRMLRDLLEPALEFFRAIPPPVLVPILMLVFGIDDTMKVIVIALGCMWPILLNTAEGVRALDEVQSDTARTYRISGFARLRHLVLPAASPQIFAGARQGLSVAIILMVISELFAASNGIGFAIVQFQRRFAIPEMWSGILLLGLLGFLLALLFRVVEARQLSWYFGLRKAERES